MKRIDVKVTENRDTFEIGKKVFTNSCGSSDYTYYWKSKNIIYQLGVNYSLGYVGLQVFDLNQNDTTENPITPANEIFLQNDSELTEILGKNWENKSASYLRKVLENYCY